MLFQLPDGAPTEVIISVGIVSVVLALSRVVKNLPKDAISKFFEYRTKKYRIIASDSKGRVAAFQKQRLMFITFVFTCTAVVTLVFISSTQRGSKNLPTYSPPSTAKKDSQAAP